MINLAVTYYVNVKDIIGLALGGIVILVLVGGFLYDKIKGGDSWTDNFKK